MNPKDSNQSIHQDQLFRSERAEPRISVVDTENQNDFEEPVSVIGPHSGTISTDPPTNPPTLRPLPPSASGGRAAASGGGSGSGGSGSGAAFERLVTEFINDQRRARRNKSIFRLLLLLVFVGFVSAFFFLPVAPTQNDCLTACTALVRIDGEIAADADASAERVKQSLRDAFKVPMVRGVVVAINSPGGSPVQAGQIYDEIKRLRKVYVNVPLYVVIEDIAASGGYYIAAAADKIYVDKASLVGSIGVVMNNFGFTGAMEKLGIEQRTQTAGRNKAFLDPFSPVNPEQKEHVQKLLDSIHRQFIKAVSEGRGQKLKTDQELFSGLIWNGEQAIKLGLADELGSVDSVARNVIGVENVQDFSYTPDWGERIARQFGVSIASYFWTRGGIR